MATPDRKQYPDKREAGAATPAPAIHAANGHNADNTVTDPGYPLTGAWKESPPPPEEPESPGTLRVLDVERMVREDPPPVPWRIQGLAVDGMLTLLAGREGLGKSLLTQSLAVGVANGETVGGYVCRKGKVLIVDAENGQYEIHRRVHSLDLPATVTMVEAVGFHLHRDLTELETLLTEHKPDLLILDSFRSLWPGGDENDNARTDEVLTPLRNLVREKNVATILLHHAGKNGHEYRGSTAIGSSVEGLFMLSRVPNDPQAKTRRKLTCPKLRMAPEPDPRWIELSSEAGRVFIDEAEPYESPDSQPKPIAPVKTELIPRLVEAVREAATRGDPITTLAALAETVGRSPKDGSVRRALGAAEKAGSIVKVDGTFLPGEDPALSESAERAEGANPLAPPGKDGPEPNTGKVPKCQTPKGLAEVGTFHDRPLAEDGPDGDSPPDPPDPPGPGDPPPPEQDGEPDEIKTMVESVFGPVEEINEPDQDGIGEAA